MDSVAGLTVADLTILTRKATRQWVKIEEDKHGSRMVAYENVGEAIGASDEWVRKFLRGDIKQPTWAFGWNIIMLYRRACGWAERNAVEAEARAEASELEGQCDEIVESVAAMVAGLAQGTTRAAEASATQVVPSISSGGEQ